MKLTQPKRLIVDDLSGDWKKDSDDVVWAVSDFQENAIAAINGKLTIRENTTSYEEDHVLDHGVRTRIKNPLNVPCRGVFAVRCVGMEIDSGNKATRKLYSLGVPRIDWESSDSNGDTLMITADFPLNHTLPCLLKKATGTESVANNTDTLINDWDTTILTRGSIISESGGTFTVSEPGTYHVVLSCRWTDGVTYTSVQLSIRQNGSNLNWSPYRPTGFTAGPVDQVTAIAKAAAGDTFQGYAYQTNGAAATRNILGSFRNMAIHRLYNDTNPRGRVRLFFYGG